MPGAVALLPDAGGGGLCADERPGLGRISPLVIATPRSPCTRRLRLRNAWGFGARPGGCWRRSRRCFASSFRFKAAVPALQHSTLALARHTRPELPGTSLEHGMAPAGGNIHEGPQPFSRIRRPFWRSQSLFFSVSRLSCAVAAGKRVQRRGQEPGRRQRPDAADAEHGQGRGQGL